MSAINDLRRQLDAPKFDDLPSAVREYIDRLENACLDQERAKERYASQSVKADALAEHYAEAEREKQADLTKALERESILGAVIDHYEETMIEAIELVGKRHTASPLSQTVAGLFDDAMRYRANAERNMPR